MKDEILKNIDIRNIEASDYAAIISVVNDWWGGRNMVDMLPKLFFIHFSSTSFVAIQGEKIVGFLIGFVSQTHLNEAYIHFAGVHPETRKNGLGQALYSRFFEEVKKINCTIVRCITSPINVGSILFHQRMGFCMEPSDRNIDGIPVMENYDGRGGDRVLFYKILHKNNK